MTKDFSSIMELASILEQKSELLAREQELSAPLLKNLSLIPKIYEWFQEGLLTTNNQTNTNSVIQRKKFLFIILFLFAPSVLAGDRLPNGMRSTLVKVFPHTSPCVISNNIADVYFIFRQYNDFRIDVEYLYNLIMKRLNTQQQIKQ